ncbi:MAG TPA: hypothetical protein VG488_12690 [Candidatus Angelobacter sp.]|jgi:hypothetical protein|nr:hypothetical protein [Candidatus Angelobacter sp.]
MIIFRISALSLLALLALVTITGCRRNQAGQALKIPSKVWGGGAGTLSIETNVSHSAFLSLELHSGSNRLLNAREDIDPGKHSWNVELAPGTGGEIRLQAKDPTPGAELSWIIKYNDAELIDSSINLDHPLGSGESLFLAVEKSDFTLSRN